MLVLVLGRCFGSAIRDKNRNISKTNRQYRSRVQATSAFHHKHTVVMATGPDDAIGMPSSGRVLSSRQGTSTPHGTSTPQGHDPAVHPPAAMITSTRTPPCTTLRRRSRPQGHHPAVHPPARITSTGSPSCGAPAGEDHVHRKHHHAVYPPARTTSTWTPSCGTPAGAPAGAAGPSGGRSWFRSKVADVGAGREVRPLSFAHPHPPARITSTGTPSCGTPSGEDHVHMDTILRYTRRRASWRSRPIGWQIAVPVKSRRRGCRSRGPTSLLRSPTSTPSASAEAASPGASPRMPWEQRRQRHATIPEPMELRGKQEMVIEATAMGTVRAEWTRCAMIEWP